MAKAKTMTRDAILAELREIAAQLEARPALYRRRHELFELAQTVEPRILQRELAQASRVTETAVNKELKRPARVG